jgi:hypothetical protein
MLTGARRAATTFTAARAPSLFPLPLRASVAATRRLPARGCGAVHRTTAACAMSSSFAAQRRGFPGDPAETDLYKRLGVSRDSTHDEIKKAYRVLAKQLHPDLNIGNDKAAEDFKRVQEAYEVLSNAAKRKNYDYTGRVAGAAEGNGFSWEFGGNGWRGSIRNEDGKRVIVIPWKLLALGIVSFFAFLGMVTRIVIEGTFTKNFANFLVILFAMSFLPRLPGALIVFYFYGWETLKTGSMADVSLLMTVHPPPPSAHGKIMASRTIEMTGVPAEAVATSQVVVNLRPISDKNVGEGKVALQDVETNVQSAKGVMRVVLPAASVGRLGSKFVATVRVVDFESKKHLAERQLLFAA